jgi:enediyne biosynthesis protein E4
MMQWAPVNALLTGDFDHDGHTDMLAGGNFFGVIPYEGKYDALPLVFAHGDGKGSLATRMPVEKNLLIRGEISDLKKIRIAGHDAVLVARNHDSLQVLAY